MKLQKLRRIIGIVMQEPVLFAESIRDNIRYGTEYATDEQIKVRHFDADKNVKFIYMDVNSHKRLKLRMPPRVHTPITSSMSYQMPIQPLRASAAPVSLAGRSSVLR